MTIDAMGCQVAIADKIVERGGDFLIAVKGNQETLHEDLGLAFHDVDIRGGDGFLSSHETEAPAHGRGEWRKCDVLEADGHITHRDKWSHVKSIVRVETERRLTKTTAPETQSRYYISSLEAPDASRALEATREHWSIENRLHWQLDVSFREDECRVYAENAAENLVVVRHIALNLLRSVKNLPGGHPGQARSSRLERCRPRKNPVCRPQIRCDTPGALGCEPYQLLRPKAGREGNPRRPGRPPTKKLPR